MDRRRFLQTTVGGSLTAVGVRSAERGAATTSTVQNNEQFRLDFEDPPEELAEYVEQVDGEPKLVMNEGEEVWYQFPEITDWDAIEYKISGQASGNTGIRIDGSEGGFYNSFLGVRPWMRWRSAIEFWDGDESYSGIDWEGAQPDTEYRVRIERTGPSTAEITVYLDEDELFTPETEQVFNIFENTAEQNFVPSGVRFGSAERGTFDDFIIEGIETPAPAEEETSPPEEEQQEEQEEDNISTEETIALSVLGGAGLLGLFYYVRRRQQETTEQPRRQTPAQQGGSQQHQQGGQAHGQQPQQGPQHHEQQRGQQNQPQQGQNQPQPQQGQNQAQQGPQNQPQHGQNQARQGPQNYNQGQNQPQQGQNQPQQGPQNQPQQGPQNRPQQSQNQPQQGQQNPSQPGSQQPEAGEDGGRDRSDGE